MYKLRLHYIYTSQDDKYCTEVVSRVAISDFGVVLATSGIARRSIFGRVLANWASLVQSCPVLPHIDPG